MSDERRQILNMLAEKKITVDEAERLLEALGDTPANDMEVDQPGDKDTSSGKRRPKYLYVSVKPKEGKRGDNVNVKIPLFLLRTGLKIGGVLPDAAKDKIGKALGEKGIDIGKLNEGDFEELVNGLGDLAITVDDEDEHVKIYCA
jgi:hypothetical protein